jgi:hypothetical protein
MIAGLCIRSAAKNVGLSELGLNGVAAELVRTCGKGSCTCANLKTLAAKCAKKGRKVREEIQFESYFAPESLG